MSKKVQIGKGGRLARLQKFYEEAYEIAFGEAPDFTDDEVLNKLRYYSELSYLAEQHFKGEIVGSQFNQKLTDMVMGDILKAHFVFVDQQPKKNSRAQRLKKFFKQKQSRSSKQQNIVLKGKNIVITGTISGMTRKQVAQKIKEIGGVLQSNVTKTTDVVIRAQKAGKGKIAKAKKYGIRVVPYKQVSHRFK